MKIKKAIGYFETGGLLCELEDGRFALIDTNAADENNECMWKAEVSYVEYTFTRGKEVNRKIPEGAIEKAIKVIEESREDEILELDDEYLKEYEENHRKNNDRE